MASRSKEPDDLDTDQQMDDDPADATTPAARDVQDGLLACDRCRRRKVKCGRGSPCRQCDAAGAQCTYDLGYKPRVRRQRVMVSNDLESNVEYISKAVDELKGMIEQLNRQAQLAQSSSPSVAPISRTRGQQLEGGPSLTAAQPSPASAHTAGSATTTAAGQASQIEYEGESSMFAHALFATAFVQNAVGSSPSFEISAEMGPIMQTLSDIVESQKQKAEAVELLFPYARPLEDGRKPQENATPPIEKVLACLRMAQESPEVYSMWTPEFESLSHFTEYVIKVCSPGPKSEAELIIVNAGLYWLFLECASVTDDKSTVYDYDTQASLCRANLETLLAHLGFHIPVTIDYVYAMSMAATYCLQTLNTSAAWAYIGTASAFSQALGLHSAVSLQPESKEQRNRKRRLFWTVYSTEKPLSLRIGRSSTFRDNDITIPRLEHPGGPDSLIRKLLPLWVEVACLQGRVYDEIYCPGAFMQPDHVRHARAHDLICAVTSNMEAEAAHKREYEGSSVPTASTPLAVLWAADRITGFSLLTLIYRSLPPQDSSLSPLRVECVEMARKALEQHEKCLALLSPPTRQVEFLGLFVDWALVQSPFVPYTILFCHIIESSSEADLHALRSFLETLERTPYATRHASSKNQLRLFQVLYSVAVKYVAVKQNSLGAMGPGGSATDSGTESQMAQSSTRHFPAGPSDIVGTPTSQDISNSTFGGASSLPGEDQFMANLGLQVDSSGGMLASWFTSNQQLMRLLENA